MEIRLQGFDPLGKRLYARLTSVPERGTLYQLSQVYSDYGYEPSRGEAVNRSLLPVAVTGTRNRILYAPPPNSNAPVGEVRRSQLL